MKRRTKRKLILLVILLVVLSALGLWFYNYTRTKSLSIDLRVQPADTLTAPQYLFSFTGTEKVRLTAPVGVLADAGLVFVSDGTGSQIFVFKQDGTLVKTFGKDQLLVPLHIAKNPKDGLLYITDRGKQGVFKFKTTGEYVGEFEPKLPEAELPDFKADSEWIPIAICFAPDGTLFVSDMLKGHRILEFAPDGSFVRSFGTEGIAIKATDLPGQLQFPNSLKVYKNELWVSDSNNRRIQIFDFNGTFKRLIPLSGLPRGMTFLPKDSGVTQGTGDVYVIVDVLTSDATLYSTSGASPVSFGTKGTAEGQFALPNDVTVGDKSVIFISDNRNMRVQAWGWQSQVSVLPRILPQQPAWCLLALPLLLLPLFFRKKQYYATADFVDAMIEADALPGMQQKRVRWLVSEADYETLRDRVVGDIKLGDLLSATEYSEQDSRALVQRYATTMEQARTLTSAQRTKLFCTQDEELRKLARILEIDTMNADEYRERFTQKKK